MFAGSIALAYFGWSDSRPNLFIFMKYWDDANFCYLEAESIWDGKGTA